VRVVVISSCTGEKAVTSPEALTLADFGRGQNHVAEREADLRDQMLTAEQLYTGQQHVRLMRGVHRVRESANATPKIDLDLWIVSAGYGLVPAKQELAPYEATFSGMGKPAVRKWASQLGVPDAFRRLIKEPYDLGLILLGDDYLDACALDSTVELGGPTLLFCGSRAQRRLPDLDGLRSVPLTNVEARRFSCGLVALKGELAARLLDNLASDTESLSALFTATDVLEELDVGDAAPAKNAKRQTARPNSKVDVVVDLPDSWRTKPHRGQLSYFIPEWDDLVDPDFDFDNDVHSGGSGSWTNEVYAHQLYPEPNYDGILISKVVAEKSKRKKELINRLGVHRFLRLPREFPVMGDCGAFGYIKEEIPPYTTAEILDYYTRLDFDFGVSIDHLIVSATESERKHRYELTISNAADFLHDHRKAGLSWTPIGAVQGWDAKSYAAAAAQYVAMGYQYIGLGGLVRTTTREVLEVLQEVHEVVPEDVKIHLFGLARINSMKAFADLGVRSVDSASLLRRAWMGTGKNYLSMDGKFYAAIRIPEGGKSFRAKRMVSEGRASADEVERLEAICLDAMRRFDAGDLGVEQTLDLLEEYDHLITPERPPTRSLLRETLEDQPWKSCPCEICRRDGIQVVLFRGNNRNRRRGFHNTYVFYRLLQRVLAGEEVAFGTSAATRSQLSLFSGDDTSEEADGAL
jgi:hypothetical protein